MWSTIVDCRSCFIHVYEKGCTVELKVRGESIITRRDISLDEAFVNAEMLAKAYGPSPMNGRQTRERRTVAAELPPAA